MKCRLCDRPTAAGSGKLCFDCTKALHRARGASQRKLASSPTERVETAGAIDLPLAVAPPSAAASSAKRRTALGRDWRRGHRSRLVRPARVRRAHGAEPSSIACPQRQRNPPRPNPRRPRPHRRAFVDGARKCRRRCQRSGPDPRTRPTRQSPRCPPPPSRARTGTKRESANQDTKPSPPSASVAAKRRAAGTRTAPTARSSEHRAGACGRHPGPRRRDGKVRQGESGSEVHLRAEDVSRVLRGQVGQGSPLHAQHRKQSLSVKPRRGAALSTARPAPPRPAEAAASAAAAG